MNLNTYYKTLSEIHGELFTKREFSKKHMGKCETYYGYLKSTSSEPSKSALVNLWHQLRYDSGVLAEQAMRVGLAWVTEELKLQSETLNRLSGTVLEDIMLRQPSDAAGGLSVVMQLEQRMG